MFIESMNAGRTQVIDGLKRQLDSLGLAVYVEAARHFEHELHVVLYMRPDGTYGKPKVTIDLRGVKRKTRPAL